MRVSIALCAFAVVLATALPAAAEGGYCGNGRVNHNEECDPGGQLHCNGDPSLATCRTGADCESGVNCYFALSCCKFNCQYVGQGATCFDGDECTGPDRCNNVGECVGGPQSGNPCDDGNTCTGNDTCVQGDCVGTLPSECDDHNPCTDDFCDEETGCGHEFNTAPCNDGQLCTGDDNCQQGVCGGTPTIPTGCDDGNVCTDDGCNPDANNGAGGCLHENNTLPCNDGQFCTQADVCDDGACGGAPFTPPACADDNECTDDFCDLQGNGGAGACAHENNTAPCDDGNGCTVNDQCSDGTCAASALNCDDGNICTNDGCNPDLGTCVHENNALPCNDGQFCTQSDVCSGGACTGTAFTPPDCNDGNVCTDDSCDSVANEGTGGCAYVNNTAPCNDEQFCTAGDSCSDGQCAGTPFTPPTCDDENVCTDDSCNPEGNGGDGACAHANNTAPCDDGQFCTTTDQCNAGQCQSGPVYDCNDGNVCTLDTCDEAADVCRYVGDSSKAGQSCDDASLCTMGDICDASGGCMGTPLVCDDGDDVCTADSCNPASGCVFNVVVESQMCMSCMDGIDNEGDGDTDNEDCDCNLLCESFNYAVVANRDSTRRTLYFGKKTRAARGVDPEFGSSNSSAPYPLGPSVSSTCSQGKLELLERSVVDGVGTAATRGKFGNGNHLMLGFYTGFVPPGELRTTGTPPYVGPREICSDTPLPCTEDSQCPQGEMCRPLMTIIDPANAFVDLTGTHPEFVECETATASLAPDFDTLFALTPTQDLGNMRYRDGDPPIVVTGPGVHVIRLGALRTLQGSTLPVIGDDATAAVVFQIKRTLTVGVRSRIELVGGLKPDQVIWLVDRSGRVYIGNQEGEPPSDDLATLPGTLLAPRKKIVIGKKARVAGAVLGHRVQLNEKAVVSHRPFIGTIP